MAAQVVSTWTATWPVRPPGIQVQVDSSGLTRWLSIRNTSGQAVHMDRNNLRRVRKISRNKATSCLQKKNCLLPHAPLDCLDRSLFLDRPPSIAFPRLALPRLLSLDCSPSIGSPSIVFPQLLSLDCSPAYTNALANVCSLSRSH
jgi:hypothetical protein